MNHKLCEPPNGDYCIRGRVRLGDIVLDAYQRGIPTRKEVDKLADKWDERAVGAVILSLRDGDNLYYCIDGQRRVAAAKKLKGEDGDIEALVWLGLIADQEAMLFEEYQDRKSLSRWDVFQSALFRHDPEAVVINSIVSSAGLSLAGSHAHDPKVIVAVGAVVKAYRQHGATRLRNILLLLKEGFEHHKPAQPNAISGIAIGGMGQFLGRYHEHEFYDGERVVAALGFMGPIGMMSRASGVQQMMPTVTSDSAWGRALYGEYNKGLRTRQLPEWADRVWTSEAFKEAQIARRKS